MEFTLSQKARPFASLRVTHGEGFRMTNIISLIVTQSLVGGDKGEGEFSLLVHPHPHPPPSEGEGMFLSLLWLVPIFGVHKVQRRH